MLDVDGSPFMRQYRDERRRFARRLRRRDRRAA